MFFEKATLRKGINVSVMLKFPKFIVMLDNAAACEIAKRNI
jgi:hypothetical protein